MCSACDIAEVSPKTGRFNAGCAECDARALAHSQEARDAMMGYPGALQAAIRKLNPDKDKYLETRVAVFKWIKRLE